MPAVLVHGVPDTHRLWDSLARCLSRTDVVAIRLAGLLYASGLSLSRCHGMDRAISRRLVRHQALAAAPRLYACAGGGCQRLR